MTRVPIITGGTEADARLDDLLEQSGQVPELPGARDAEPLWTVLTAGASGPRPERPISTRTVVLRIVLAALLVILVVVVAGAYASRRLAEREAVNDAAHTTDLIAESVVQPALDDGILSNRPQSTTRLDALKSALGGAGIVRVKLWTPEGRIVYSDEARLVGQVLALDEEERSVFASPKTVAEVTDLSRPENRFERGQGKLLEVYRPVWTPSGQPLLFETYSRYTAVRDRSGQIWRGLAGITLTSLLLLIIFLVPLTFRLMDGLRRTQAQREELLRRAVDASAQERRRVAATLHDGPVQDLAATSFALTAASARAEAAGADDYASMLLGASQDVRENIRGLRSLLVDIYPASLSSSGLAAALGDLASSVRGHGIAISLMLPDEGLPPLSEDAEQLIFRIAQECLRNAAKHSRARSAELRLALLADDVTLEVIDDGTGFDVGAALAAPAEGHFGLRLMVDLAKQNSADLKVATSPARGTHWKLSVPRLARHHVDAGDQRASATGRRS